VNPALLPFAVTYTALYLGLGLLPFASVGIGWGEALTLLPDRLFAAGIPLASLLLALPLGWFWQGTLWSRATSARLTAAGAVFLVLGLLAVLLQLGQIYFPPRLAVPGGLFAPLLGFLAGMSLWWLLGPSLSRRLSALPRRLWPVLVVAAAGSVLLPLDLGAPLSAPALPGGLSAYVSDIPQRFYLLIKSAILWAPVGFIYTLAGRGSALPRWGIALVAAWILEGLSLLWGQPLKEVLELLFALPGVWVGAWLGERSLLQRAPVALSRAPRAQQEVAAIPEPRAGAAVRDEAPPRLPAAPEPAKSRAGHSRRHRQHAKPAVSRQPHLLRWLAGGLLLLAAVAGLANFPLWPWGVGLAVGLVLYLVALWVWPLAWLVVVPAALPLLDLAPWTGSFFLDEFDLLMLVTAGTLVLRGRRESGAGRVSVWPLFALWGGSILISALLGLGSPPPLDANAFSSYWSPYNSLRVAKGFVWGALVFLLLRLTRPGTEQLVGRLALGMGLGLLGVGLVGAWEHVLYVGFEGRHETYRIISLFSSMHTGGGHIEAYLVAALPFLWLATPRFKNLLVTGPLMLLTAYVMVYTVARGGVLATALALGILFLGSVRLALRTHGHRYIAPLGMLLLVTLVLVAGVGGGYFQKRFGETGRDWQTRVDHWTQAIAMMDGSLQAQLFGMGLGSFPRIYLERGPADNQPATFGFASERDNTFFRIGTGQTIYYAQRIAFRAGQNYRLELDVRSRQGDARIDTPICEKQMLNSRQCAWQGHVVPGDGQWHKLSRVVSSAQVGAEDWLHRPPVELFLYNPGKGGVVDVDNLRLLDQAGHDLLCNGDFSRGDDCWFFKTHSHLPWHIKNVWVHVLFEQGWLGLLAFTGLTLLALSRLARAGWRGHRLAWAWLASLAGLLMVGMFDSLFDAPRLATLLMALLLLGAGYDWEGRGDALRRRSRGRHTAHGNAPVQADASLREAIDASSTPSAR